LIADALGLVDANEANLTIWQERNARLAAEEEASVAKLREHAANHRLKRQGERINTLEEDAERVRSERDDALKQAQAERDRAGVVVENKNAEISRLKTERDLDRQLLAAARGDVKKYIAETWEYAAERDAAKAEAAEYARERNAETRELTECRQQLAAALKRLARPKGKALRAA